MSTTATHEAFLAAFAKELADKGQLIEAGWVGLRLATSLHTAPPGQLHDMRMAFMAGAQHLFATIMSILDPGEEPTSVDLARMEKISAELEAYAVELQREIARMSR